MRLSSLQLEAFYMLGQTRNFSKAAQQLHITQSAFSQRVINLEQELGTTLVIRDKTEIRLTGVGEKLLRHCEVSRNLEADFLNALTPSQRGRLTGVIRVGGFSSIMRSLVLPGLAPLMRRNPDLSIISFSVELGELLGLLKSSRADVIITNSDPRKEGIRSEFLGYEENVLVRSKQYAETDVYLDHDENDVTTSSYFRLMKTKPLNPRTRYLDDVYGLLDGVRLGYGKAVLPRHLIAGYGDLEVIHPETKLMVPVYLLQYEQPYYTALQKKLQETLCRHLKKKLAQTR